MSKKKITVCIAPDGTITSTVSGVYGAKCADYIPILEKLLDAKTADIQKTREYHMNTLQEHTPLYAAQQRKR